MNDNLNISQNDFNEYKLITDKIKVANEEQISSYNLQITKLKKENDN